MRALTLHEPWASAIAYGVKRIETRGWATSCTGPLAIHAARRWGREQAREWDLLRIEVPELPSGPSLGCVVATAYLIGCWRMDDAFCRNVNDTEQRWGWYAPGRYAWRLRNVVRLPQPVEAKGAQGLWTVKL